MALGPVGQIHISVTDLERSVGFYRDVLGIELQFVVPGQSMAFFSSGDVRLYLGVASSPEFQSRCVLYFRVTDIDAETERLRGLGAGPLDPPRVIHRDAAIDLWMTFLTDPDGHQIALMEEKPR